MGAGAVVIAAHIGDLIWVLGMLLCALICLRYVQAAQRDDDMALVVVAGTVAAGFALAAGAYVWLLW